LRARPEPTQLEHLSDASFFGKLLVFPANVILDWKDIASYKNSSLFGLIDSDEGKKFYNIDTRSDFYNTTAIYNRSMTSGYSTPSARQDLRVKVTTVKKENAFLIRMLCLYNKKLLPG
jgi:hypothetical protein